ncbi:hypothetical protein Taro_006004 [Colocasia esculenta]|uniref:Pentatricopeptide repeat-containing protein n=1 Tax=Colocasia esculenta TaxID=4460 RepID=A0A843TUS0_COLES|nr:hypothetical protein [Colocasia esculenta]
MGLETRISDSSTQRPRQPGRWAAFSTASFSGEARLPLPLSTRSHASFLHLNGFLNSCSSLAQLQRLHACAITRGLLPRSPRLAAKFITLAAALAPALDYARRLFDAMPDRDTAAWNTIIRAYADAGPCEGALFLYRDMHLSGLPPDRFTFPFVVRSCAVLSALDYGRQVHCNVIKNVLGLDVYVQSALVAMYAQNGEVPDAELVFEEMAVRNVVSWTTMVAAYVQNGAYEKSLEVFASMVGTGLQPNEVTLASVLPACVRWESLRLGKLIHGYGIKSGLDSHPVVGNSLIAMYGKCGHVETARSLFDGMTRRTLASWNAMVATYEQNNEGKKAIKLFRTMQTEKVAFDYITLLSVISACASSGALDVGRWVHNIARNKGIDANLSIGNALVDMYAKCGSLQAARHVFDNLPQRSIVSWSAMISAYAAHGHGEAALELFSQMKAGGVQPNSCTFVSVLAACSHYGIVEGGKGFFDSMENDFSITPSHEHYACMVDLLSRAGRLAEAYAFVEKMPIRPDAGVWCSLLGACRIHGNLELAEIVAGHILQLDSQSATCYVLMSNIYAEAGRWEDAERLRKLMKELELRKDPAHSVVKKHTRSPVLSLRGSCRRERFSAFLYCS